MAKLFVLAFCAAVVGVLAEPPSSYLPPQARGSPSSVYGAPNGGFRSNGNGKASSFHSHRTGSQSFSYNSIHENQFGGSQSKSLGAAKPFNGNGGLSRQIGAPGQSYKAPGQNGFGGRNGNGFGVSQQYGVPGFGASGNGFGASSKGFGPSQKYGAPGFGASGNGFGAASSGFGGPSQQYGAPGFGGSGFGGRSNGISQQYGAPEFSGKSSNHRFGNGAKFGNGNGNGHGNGFGAPAPVYGAPSSAYGAPFSKMDDDLSEPANYEYTYEVQAADESGAEFGHQESREDEFARGVYHVLLPDGRTQIVEYEADEEGFRPVIRYEEPEGYAAAGGPQGPY